tara:strand:+ start:76 stop:1272 length:1197 start_codon:yes stop_codon:yes gene_type:complete
MKKIIILLFVITSSCSSKEGFLPGFIPDFISDYFEEEAKPYSDLPSFDSKVDIDLVWENEFSGEIEEAYSFLKIYKYENQIYIPTNEKNIHIVSDKNGKLEKSIEIELDVFSDIIVDSKLIYFGSKQDTVTAIDRENNSVLWQRVMSSEVMSLSQILNDTIFVKTNDSKITAIDVKTGKYMWVNSQIPASLSVRGSSSPIIYSDMVIVGFEDGKIISYNHLSGDINWQIQIPSIKSDTIIDRLNDIDGKMLIDEGTLFAISYQGNLVAVDTFSGQVLWSREASSLHGLDGDIESVFYNDNNGVLWSIDKFSGKPLWKQDKLYRRLTSPPIYINDLIIVTDIENYAHIIDAQDGNIIGRFKIKNPIQSYFTDFDALYLLDKEFSLKKYVIKKSEEIISE